MTNNLTSRRTFLKRAARAAAGAAACSTSCCLGASPTGGKTMRLGGPIFIKSDDPAVLAKAHRDAGYRAAYVTMKLSPNDTDRIAAIVKEFARQDVLIAEVPAFNNMLDPNPEKSRQNIAFATNRLAVADQLGARNCVNIAGSYNPDLWYGPNPKNLSQQFMDAAVENCRKIIDAVKPRRTVFSIEMMPWSLPTNPDDYLRLIKAIDRKGFGVHLDVCNTMYSPSRVYNNSEVIRECFKKLGRWIASCHAKDLKWGAGGQMCVQEVIPGTGVIDYKTFLQQLWQLPQEAPLMLEHLQNEQEYAQGRQYIQRVAQGLGLSFGTDRAL
jgi:sugar phosphate isomerase/epimerase